ncbi:unnamed protein product [Phaedon cochleariae]|uniref:Spondin-1 n=1 Tax=Phaedon cochleariae TaxID=80249 RepID=A0A9P0DSI5_PHACE|nr:unnamed protein product [Phaedon cochleariae]
MEQQIEGEPQKTIHTASAVILNLLPVLWMAPSKGSGCIKMKATVVESVDTWFSEEGQLTKVLCEESHDTEDTQPRILKQCCTCDEAKYEVYTASSTSTIKFLGDAAPIHTLKLLDSVQKRAIRHVSDASLTNSLTSLEHRRRVGDLSLFHRYSHGRCSSEISTIIVPPLAVPARSTCRVEASHPFVVTLETCRTSLFEYLLIQRTARLWNTLPGEVFSEAYNLQKYHLRGPVVEEHPPQGLPDDGSADALQRHHRRFAHRRLHLLELRRRGQRGAAPAGRAWKHQDARERKSAWSVWGTYVGASGESRVLEVIDVISTVTKFRAHKHSVPKNRTGRWSELSSSITLMSEMSNTFLDSTMSRTSDHIRTIIKARGISHPNITGKTFAVFRVDNRHHLVSLVSMIDPSPDWIVGVSSLELCLRNCSWIEAKVVNLYPWDVGTDDGITYLSPNQPSSPRLPIRRVKTNVPNDSRSPFYDVTNTPMKPFARLTLTRQRLYEKSCDANPKEETEDDAACETEAWSSWSPCSVTCGRGIKYKQRRPSFSYTTVCFERKYWNQLNQHDFGRYKHEDSKFSCHKKLTDRSSCEAVQKYCPHKLARQFEDPLCELGPWSEWSSCSVTCGKGTMTRDRKYKNRLAAKTCAAGKAKSGILQQNLECWIEGECEDSEERISEDCPKKPWSDWSPCSVTCGRGYKERYRLSLDHKSVRTKYWPLHDTYKSKSMEEFDEDDPCNNFKTKETVECYENECQERHHQNVSIMACGLPKDPGSCKSNMDKWYFDTLKGRCEIFAYSGCAGNLNNFNTLEQCQTLCSKYQKEMLVNSTILKKELGISVSGVLTYNIQNDANAQPSSTNMELDDGDDFRPQTDTPKVDCDVSKWSNWGSCIVQSGDCGIGHKEKFRVILRLPKNGGHPCPQVLLKRKKCRISCKAQTNEASDFKDNKIDTSCIMSSWFPWSACGEKCEMKYQYRIRYAVATPGSEEYECEDEVQRRRCDCG